MVSPIKTYTHLKGSSKSKTTNHFHFFPCIYTYSPCINFTILTQHKLKSFSFSLLIHSPPTIISMEALQSWVSAHKLTSVGTLWASAVGASLIYSRSNSPLKPSLRLIHARMHAQALTLAVLSGAAVYHYYEKRTEEEASSSSK